MKHSNVSGTTKVKLFGRWTDVDAAYWERHLAAMLKASEVYAGFMPIATEERHRAAVRASDEAYKAAMATDNRPKGTDGQFRPEPPTA